MHFLPTATSIDELFGYHAPVLARPTSVMGASELGSMSTTLDDTLAVRAEPYPDFN